MGAILAKFRRKATTGEILEKIQKELDSIEEFKQSTQAYHKKLIGILMTYFSVLYLLAAVFVYFKYFYHPSWQDIMSQLKLLLPFLIAPFIFMVVKNLLTWWYHRKLRLNESKAEKLRKEKETMLEKVMETETYKVAKEILEKFGMEPPVRPNMNFGTPGPNSSMRMGSSPAVNRQSQQQGIELRRRHTAHNTTLPATGNRPAQPPQVSRMASEATGRNSPVNQTLAAIGGQNERPNESPARQDNVNSPALLQRPPGPMQRRPPGPPLPRPVLPRERGYMDRLVEYLVGDGPTNRYALICRQCQSHNGMALKEEFEYIAYRCCYCFYWNPARKQRPVAPKIENTRPSQSSTESSTEDESEHTSRGNGPTASVPAETETPENVKSSQGAEEAQPQEQLSQGEEQSQNSDMETEEMEISQTTASDADEKKE